jgi:hypothetical protein
LLLWHQSVLKLLLRVVTYCYPHAKQLLPPLHKLRLLLLLSLEVESDLLPLYLIRPALLWKITCNSLHH